MQGLRAISKHIYHANTQALYYGPKGITPQVNGVIPDFKASEKINQDNDYLYKREEDHYMYPLESHIKVKELLSPDRIQERNLIKECMNKSTYIKEKYEAQTKYEKLIFDNQLETSLEVLKCANEEKIEIYKGIDIPKVENAKFISMEKFVELVN